MEIKKYPIFKSKKYDQNIENFGNFQNSCVCCGRPTAEHLYIHVCVEWKALNTLKTDEDVLGTQDQGCFAIGPECAKKFPKEFIFKSK